MSKQALKSIHKLINMAVQEAPVEQQFLRDLKASIEMVDAKISRKPSQCYKPSSLKCIRNMYFQVAGVDEDPERGNSCLIGICESGTDRHERIQAAVSNMKEAGMDCEYINVADYIKENGLDHLKIKGQTNFETKLYYPALNLSFLCDCIIKYQGKYYILEKEAPENYKLNEEKMWFEITEDGQVVKCNMTDEAFEVPNTGLSNINYELIGSIVLVISGLGLMIYGIKKRK